MLTTNKLQSIKLLISLNTGGQHILLLLGILIDLTHTFGLFFSTCNIKQQ